MKKIDWLKLIGCILFAEVIGGLSVVFAGDQSAIYYALRQPPLAPPSWLFGVIWPVLYALIGIVFYNLLQSTHPNRNVALGLFALQLLFNFAWSILFFTFQLFWVSVVDIILLVIVLSTLMAYLWPMHRPSFYMLLPYWIWLVFATYLNIGVAILNP